jgi:hypothetical protein
MTTRKRRKAPSLPAMMTDLTMASWETITHRTLMMAQNACPPAEYQRMLTEKTQAVMESSTRLILSGGMTSLTSLIAPWYKLASANAKRLRNK